MGCGGNAGYGDVFWNDVGKYNDDGGGVNWAGGSVASQNGVFGITSTFYNPGINQWNTYEAELVSGTLGNFDGKFNTWINGAAGLHGTYATNGGSWNNIYNGTNSFSNQSNPLYYCVSMGELTDNGPHTGTAWTPGMSVTSGNSYTQGTNPYNGRPWVFQCATTGTSGSIGPIGCGGNPRYELILGNQYSEPGTSSPVIKWNWICDDSYNPAGLSGVSWYYGFNYLDDSLCRVFNSTEASYNLTGTSFYQRELQIPTAWDSTGTNITYSVRQGVHTTGETTYQYIINASGTAQLVGTMQW